jgi:hypothetical protein
VDSCTDVGDEPAQITQSRIECFDNDNPDCELRDILLVAHSLVRRNEDIERRRRMTKKVAILQARPTFLLNGSDHKLRQLAPKLSGHVLVE